jgi:hypothetical protein
VMSSGAKDAGTLHSSINVSWLEFGNTIINGLALIPWANDAELGHSTVDEQQLKQNLPEDSTTKSALTSGLGKSLVNEDELTSPYAMDTSVCRIVRNLACCVDFFVLSIPHASNPSCSTRARF